MIIENKLTKNQYRALVLKEVMLGRKINFVTLGLYLAMWRVLYSLAKVGNLRTNLPIFFVIGLLLLLMVVEIVITYIIHLKNAFLYNNMSQLTIDDKQLTIEIKNLNYSRTYTWDKLVKIRENKKWFFLYFKGKCFMPIVKQLGQNSYTEELGKLLRVNKPIKKTHKIWVILIFIVITVGGVYEVGTCAFKFNGALSWKINELQTDRKIELKDKNFYTSKLQGIMDSVKANMSMEPNLMTSNIVISFEPDGTIKTIDTYIYGYDINHKLKTGYLLYYDKSKASKLTVHTQDWGNGGTLAYEPKNDLSIPIRMLNKIPLEKDTKQWKEKEYAVIYKGIHSWGYNLEGIRIIDENGLVTIPKVANKEIVGPSLSLYCPGKENEIIPHRYVYTNINS